MKKILKQSIFLALCFVADILCFTYLQYPLLNATFNFSLVTLLYYNISGFFFISLFLLGLKSFLITDLFGFNFLYLIPLFIVLHITRHHLAHKPFTAQISLLIFLLCNRLSLEYFGLKLAFWGWYTFWEIGVNLILLLISLKWLSTVERGNRF